MPKKITSKDCIAEIHNILPGKKWKRVSKKKLIERVFQDEDWPSLRVTVIEDEGQLTVSFGRTGEKLNVEEECQACLGDGRGADDEECGECGGTGKAIKKVYYFDYAQEMEDEHDAGGLPFYPKFFIVSKEFWEKNGHFDDGVNQTNVKMPQGFYEAMEGCFEYDGTKKDAVKKLLDAGFLPLPKVSLADIVFAIEPGTRDGSEPTYIWFARKDAWEQKKEDVLSEKQWEVLFDALSGAKMYGDRMDPQGHSTVFRLECPRYYLREELSEMGLTFSEDYQKWVRNRR